MNSFLTQYFQTIKRFLPGENEEISAGVDIGTGECKLVQLSREGDDLVLLDWSVETVKNGDVSATIRTMLDKLDKPCTSLYTSVFGKGTLIRYIDMPRMSIDDLQNSFAIEADKYFPFAQDQIYTDCYILDPNSKEAKMAVMAAAVKKELVDQRVQLLTGLGIQPHFIGINPVALANIINVLGIEKEEKESPVVAILDMGGSISNLTIMIDKLPWFTRDIFLGGRELTKRISNTLGIDFDTAEQLKSNPQERLEEVISACEAGISNIVRELRLSFDYFMTEKNKEIDVLLLTGGGSMLEGIEDVFAKNLDIKVRRWNPLSLLKMSAKVSEEEVNKESLRLGVALGLALYQT